MKNEKSKNSQKPHLPGDRLIVGLRPRMLTKEEQETLRADMKATAKVLREMREKESFAKESRP